MSELTALYQDVILDHCKRPRNFGPLPGATRSAEGYNPLCGDKVKVHVALTGDRVERVGFEGVGCAISTASASLLTEAVAGRTLPEARELFRQVRAMLTGDRSPGSEEGEDSAARTPLGELVELDPSAPLGKLAALAGVREYPMRVKCATLAWHTLLAALDPATTPAAPVSTE